MKTYTSEQIFIIFVMTICSVLHGTDAHASNNTGKPVNVILITISSLRADHVGAFGYERDTTPCFDSFAKDNILFRNAFATSGWTMPAHGSIFTSLYPGRHGATHIDKTLDDEHLTLAEFLNRNGFFCAGFSCNPRLNREYGYAQGFDFFDDFSVSIMLESLALGIENVTDINKKRTNALINDAAIRWLQNNTHKQFFLFVHYYDNHWDYLPPSPYDNLYDPDYDGPIDGTEISREPLFSNPPDAADIKHIIALYDGEVKQTDRDFSELLKVIEDKGLFDNSIVVILGDHGEQFYEHGFTNHHGLYEELIHVPMAISIPGLETKGKAVDSLVSQVDILPTILDYLGITIPESSRGKSLKPLIEGKTETVNQFVYTEYTGGAASDCFAVRSSRYKLCMDSKDELFAYDLLKDPKEQIKIAPTDFPEEVKSLQNHLIRIKNETSQ